MEQTQHSQNVSVHISHASLRKYIYWSTMLGLFSGILSMRVPFHVRLFDVIMLSNFLLMLPLANRARIRIPIWIPCFILYLAVSGSIGIAGGTDTIGQVAKEFAGITVSLLYYYCFFRMIGNDFERAFTTYARIAFWFAIIGLVVWPGTCIYLHSFERLRGLTAEPTTFCQLVIPAYYWYGYKYMSSRKHGTEVAVLTLAVILAGSSNGYLGALCGLILLLSKRMKHLVIAPLVAGGLAILAYTSSSSVRLRINDTVLAVSTQDVKGSNLSTYALISNMFVTEQVLKESPVIGNGLGSHPISHARFIGDVSGVESFLEADSEDLNAPDASSLTLRVLSELGVFGFLSMMVFLYHFHVGGKDPSGAISNALLVYFFIKLLRGPAYFEPELFLFIYIYILNYRQLTSDIRSLTRSRENHRLPIFQSTPCAQLEIH